MKKLLFVIFFSILLFSCKEDESQPVPEKVFTGNITLSSQEQVNDFVSNRYTEIKGNIYIGDSDFIDDISSLAGFETLQRIDGGLHISTDDLITLNGLNNLQEITDYFSIRAVGNAMKDLTGLESLTQVGGDFQLYRISSITSLLGIENLEYVGGDFILMSGYSIASTTGLNKLSSINGNLVIWGCDSLINLNGFSKLENIGGDLNILRNESLESLEGLQNLKSTNNITIGILETFDQGNKKLSDFCALQNLFLAGEFGEIIIQENLYNPMIDDIIDGNCSQ